MSNKRVKVKSESIVKEEEQLKVRPKNTKKTIDKVEEVLSEMIPIEKSDTKKIPSDNRFERHKAFGDLNKRAEISEKVKQGLLKWAFYGVENDNGYQYYLKIKK